MTTDAPIDAFMRSLAGELACGGSVDAWARSRDVCAEMARGWTALPAFREFLENCRVEHAERMVGKIAGCVERAIERLVEISECVRKPSIALAATKAIIKNWMDLSVYFVQERTYQFLQARAKEIVAARKAEKQAMKGRRWQQ